jgi:RimJ/RimL family protein N-acetyltransferase
MALIALNPDLAALQARNHAAFFDAIAVAHEPAWPPAPFQSEALEWAAKCLAQDREGQGWYGWALLSNEETSEGERSPSRLLGLAGLIGRPDDEGEVELAFGLLPEFRGRGFGRRAVRALTTWAFANGATRVISHLDAADVGAAQMLAKSGFADTGFGPYPGVARWALDIAA